MLRRQRRSHLHLEKATLLSLPLIFAALAVSLAFYSYRIERCFSRQDAHLLSVSLLRRPAGGGSVVVGSLPPRLSSIQEAILYGHRIGNRQYNLRRRSSLPSSPLPSQKLSSLPSSSEEASSSSASSSSSSPSSSQKSNGTKESTSSHNVSTGDSGAPESTLQPKSKSWEDKYKQQRLKYGAWKVQGLRETMEDNFDIIDRGRCGFLYASVFDGHGGCAASDYLRQRLYKIFSNTIAKVPGEAAPISDESPDFSDESLQIPKTSLMSRPPEAEAAAAAPELCSVDDLEDILDSMDPIEEVAGLSCPIPLTRVLRRMFEEADTELLDYLKTVQDHDQSRSGSTATVALVRKDRIIIANVGDSRAVLGRGDSAIDLSKEHRAYGDSDITWNEIARIEDCGAWVDDGRVLDILGITRAFGDPDFKGEGLNDLKKFCVEMGYWAEEFAESLEFTGDPIIATPDVTEICVTAEDDILIVASDGLWDVYDSGEAIGTARVMLEEGATLEEAAKSLCENAIAYGSEDNVAVVIIDLSHLHDDKQRQQNDEGGEEKQGKI